MTEGIQIINFGKFNHSSSDESIVISRNVHGNSFVLVSNYIPAGSSIVFDDLYELPLIPYVIYNNSFKNIKLVIKNPFRLTGSSFNIANSSEIKGLAFSEQQPFNIYNYESEPFFLSVTSTSSTNLKLRNYVGAKSCIISRSCFVVHQHCFSVAKNPLGGYSSDKHLINYCLVDETPSGTTKDIAVNESIVPNENMDIDLDVIYTSSPSASIITMFYFSNNFYEKVKYNQLLDYKTSLNLNTSYTYRYGVPNGTKNIVYRIEDIGGVSLQTIGIYYLLGAGSISGIGSGSSVSLIQGRYENFGGTKSILVDFKTNTTVDNNVQINLGFLTQE